MHTTVEMVHKDDVEHTIELMYHTLLSLDVTPNLFQAAEARGIRVQHLPIVDVNVPTEAQWADVKAVVHLVREHLNNGHNVVVHCRGGRGRTGTIVSLVLTTYGHAAHEAIALTRQAQPGALETQEQAEYVRRAAERLTRERT